MTRLSRPCYDKPHRCPGWAGGGTRSVKRGTRYPDCPNGSIRTRVAYKDDPGEYKYPGSARWHFGYCTKCDVITWPFALRWLDWRYTLGWKIADPLRWWWRDRRRAQA